MGVRAFLFLALVGLVLGSCSGDSASPEDVTHQLYGAYVAGDVDAFLGLFADDGMGSYRLAPTVIDLGVGLHQAPVSDPATAHAFEAFVAVQPEVTRACEEVSELEIRCRVSYRDDFYGPAAIEMVFTDTLKFNSSAEIVELESALPDYQSLLAYHSAFFEWLEGSHPDAYESADIELLYSLMRPSAYPVLVPYVAEFVEQSNDYPVG